MDIQHFYDPGTGTLSYVVFDRHSHDAIVIDPILDFNLDNWRVSMTSIEKIEQFIRKNKLNTRWILDTHVHADHITGAARLKQKLDCPYAVGSKVIEVQDTLASILKLGADFPCDGSQFDRLLNHGEVLEAGELSVEVIHTPGHTPSCSSYKINNSIFVGDVLFPPDVGVARCDFPGGNANTLFSSITKILFGLPDDTMVYVGHDYPANRALQPQTTIGETKLKNSDLPPGIDEHIFALNINQRDKQLPLPRLFFQSVQVNINGGIIPLSDEDDGDYFKIPINLF